ncbi:MAG: YraN family protein [Gammaproteobacteria bacterium]
MDGFREHQAAGGSAGTTKQRGDRAEDLALGFLQGRGLRLLRRNFRTPGRGGGEIDLIMREPDGTVVFVEVRQRVSTRAGGAAASVTGIKQRRIVFAARHFLLQMRSEPPCRFDVVVVQGAVNGGDRPALDWLRAAFDAGATF